MTISSEVRKAGPFRGNGSATSFPFDFKIFSSSDLAVYLTDPSGAESVLGGSDYTAHMNADQESAPGGTVVKTTPLAAGYALTITSKLPYLQPVRLTNQGGFYPKVINTALDRLTVFAQQLDEQVGRAVKIKISDPIKPEQLLDGIKADTAAAKGAAAAAAGSASAALASESAAAGSASAALASESAAAGSASAAAGSATTAGTRATNAGNSATAAANSATAAANSATAAANSASAAATSATNAANASRLTAGTVTTGAPGTSASVSITGAAGSQVLNITVPRGDVGATGQANTLAIGTVASGASAAATITGTAPNQTLNLTLPKGDTGPVGPQGPSGPGSGDVLGPGTTVTADALAQWSGTTGTAIKAVKFSGIPKLTAGVPSAAVAGTDYVVPSGSITGNAGTATTLQTARTINGTSFNGSANITTSMWGPARTLTIGNTGKNVDGSANVSWSLAEILGGGVPATAQGLGSGVDLNTIKTPGFYFQPMDANAASGTNYPATIAGALMVLKSSGVNQIYCTYQPAYPRLFFRSYYDYSDLWSTWREIYHSGNLGAATETTQGIVELATAAEARALASATLALTPARLADAFKGENQSLAGTGYQRLPGGLIIQWGVTNSASAGQAVSATFAIAFPSACLQATMSTGTAGANVYVNGVNFTATTISGRTDGSGVSIARYIAIGY